MLKRYKNQILYILAAVALVILMTVVQGYRDKIVLYEEVGKQVNELLAGKNKVPGYSCSCGVLSQSRAEAFLKVPLVRTFGQGPLESLAAMENPIFWEDSCEYVDPTQSTKYVELHISTFQTNKQARQEYPEFFQIVNSNEELEPVNYGQELVYDAGVYYLLADNKVIRVSANNGNSADIESFSRTVFDEIVAYIQ